MCVPLARSDPDDQTEASRVLGSKFQPRIHKQPSRVLRKNVNPRAVQGGEGYIFFEGTGQSASNSILICVLYNG